ncbi:uncharacterized protein [Pyrus communis]|uniref:uncharacterized protein n=1 Tax=Pyrus communis TaxID=23211 RepID=UPI0035BFDC88
MAVVARVLSVLPSDNHSSSEQLQAAVLKGTEQAVTTKVLGLEAAITVKLDIRFMDCRIFTDHKSLKHVFTQKELNLRQRRWMKLISDYDCTIEYHHGHANAVANAFSRRSHGQLASFRAIHVPLLFSLRETSVTMTPDPQGALSAHFQVKPILVDMVKAERQRPERLMQNLPTPAWKWEDITMDFVYGLPMTQSRFDVSWVIVDRLTKIAHFPHVRQTCLLEKLAKLFIDNIVKLYGVPVTIVSDRDPRFTFKFWRAFNAAMDT